LAWDVTDGSMTIIAESGSVANAMSSADFTVSTDDKWHHYAVSLKNDDSSLNAKFYKDGSYIASAAGTKMNEVTGSLIANLGAARIPAVTKAHAAGLSAGQLIDGYGKLSGSIDEFRFWKTSRTSKEIARNWFAQVGAGSNTDDSNVNLGVYYKFNEGITTNTTTDSIVLDYSGRLSNGDWTGYTTNSRATGSAIVEASASLSEFKDPIIYASNPEVNAYLTSSMAIGKLHDHQNNASIYASMPTWIVEEDQPGGGTKGDLSHLVQSMSSYLDTLHLQIGALSKIKNMSYTTASYKPLPFSSRMLDSLGFETEDLFIDATILEEIQSRSETENFKEKLVHVKSQIYENIYNNLVYIYKTKGTHSSIRNLVRCFGVDESLIKVNIYANEQTYQLEDTYLSTVIRRNYVNFNHSSSYSASIYQFSSSANPNSLSYLTPPTVVEANSGLSVTFETDFIFPKKIPSTARIQPDYRYSSLSASLFGVHATNAITTTDLTWNSTDTANFQVYAIRSVSDGSSTSVHRAADVRFVLTGSNNLLPMLTSSVFNDVYENKQWNFAVKVYPTKYPYTGDVNGVSGSGETYTVEFYGANAELDIIEEEFAVSGTISHANAVSFLTANKTLYAGAHNTNFSGSTLTATDVRFGSAKVWLSRLDQDTLREHAKNPNNIGVLRPQENAFVYETEQTTMDIPMIETLALNWEFDTLSASDDSGQFLVEDLSSGSADPKITERYGWYSGITKRQYTARGDGFDADATNVVKKEYVHVAKQQLPEVFNSENMVNIHNNDDRIFTRETRPINYFFALEKNMYQTVSEEMMNFFASVVHFNNLIGEPVHKFRQEYKGLAKLRQIFFETVNNTPDVEKYINFYKWFDQSLGRMITQLFPATAQHSDELRTVIESHVLERSKYQSKFPTLEMKADDPESNFFGVGELKYDWKHGHAALSNYSVGTITFTGEPSQEEMITLSGSNGTFVRYSAEGSNTILESPTFSIFNTDGLTATQCASNLAIVINGSQPTQIDATTEAGVVTVAQKARGAAGNTTISSGLSNVTVSSFSGGGVMPEDDNCLWWKDRAERDGILSSGWRDVDANRVRIKELTNTVTVSGSTYALRQFSKPYRFESEEVRQIHGGINFNRNKKVNAYRELIDNKNPAVTGTSIALSETSLRELKDCSDDSVLDFSPKVRINTVDLDGEDFDGDSLFPFNVISSSKNQHTEFFLQETYTGRDFTNVHHDVYEPTYEAPLQSPFTNEHVGGNQHRHIDLNDGDDEKSTRAEAWDLEDEEGSNKWYMLAPQANDPKAVRYRDETAKRPLNIRNIQHTTASAKLGNFSNNYEVVQTSGRSQNNHYFTGQGGVAVTSAESTAVSGVIDFTLPDRTSDTTKSIFVERFSAPGGSEVMSRGFLDVEAEEYSAYNAMPWRNLTVRQPLETLLARHTAQFGIDSEKGSPYASYHKTHRNTLRRIEFSGPANEAGAAVLTGAAQDNWYVQHMIPQSDMQYAWITASAITSVYGYEQPDFSNASEASTDITFMSASEIGSYFHSHARFYGAPPNQNKFIPDNFVGLNINLYEPLTSNANFLGYPNSSKPTSEGPSSVYLGQPFLVNQFSALTSFAGSVKLLNGLLSRRNGPYGYPSWKQVRTGEHPLARYQRNNNILSVQDPPITKYSDYVKSAFGAGYTRSQKAMRGDTFRHYTEAPVTIKNKPLRHVVSVKNKTKEEVVNIDYTHANNLSAFTSIELNNRLGLTGQKGQTYEQILGMYENEDLDENNPIKGFKYLKYSETIYPREANTFLGEIRGRQNYVCNFWRETRTERTETDVGGAMGHTASKQSMWPLDARENFAAENYAVADQRLHISSSDNGQLGEGQLMNDTSIFHNGTPANLKLAPTYARRVLEKGPGADLIWAGDSKWEAAEQAGKNPFFKSYADYAKDLRAAGKEYSIIPEFKISDHMDYYVTTKAGNFLADNNGYLSVTGSAYADSSENGFYKTYSHTDFMKHFELIQDDHKSTAETSAITLSCKALMKFLPYDGFYPAHRTVQLAELFSQSYGPNLHGTEPEAKMLGYTSSAEPLFKSLFAPGILYNTIKSGIAVDWPIHTGPFEVYGPRAETEYNNTHTIAKEFPTRLPFETILEPFSYAGGLTIVSLETHPSASLNVTSSLSGEGSPLYSMAMHNFLAETTDFFLSDGKLTTHASLPDTSPNFGQVTDENMEYRMKVVLSDAKIRSRFHLTGSGVLTVQQLVGLQHAAADTPPFMGPFNPKTLVMYEEMAHSSSVSGNAHPDLPYLYDNIYGSSFGPPVKSLLAIGASTPSVPGGTFEPFTPPYYNGYADIELSWKPHDGARGYSALEIINNLTFSFFRMAHTWGHTWTYNSGSIAVNSAMQITASVNIFNLTNTKLVEYGPLGAVKTVKDDPNAPVVWSIQPKFETPVLDFSSVSINRSITYGTGSLRRGMWHQYGEIPTEDAGIFLEVQDLLEQEKGIFQDEQTEDPSMTGSLADLVGFKRTSQRIGQIRDQKIIREAIVAVPYLQEGTTKQFFPIEDEVFDSAMQMAQDKNSINPAVEAVPDPTLVKMVKSMQNYVFPPRMDFITNKTIDPFVAYIFEFTHKLTKQDLADIWQNLPPEIGTRFEKRTATISHKLLSGAMLKIIPDNLRWMLFKVKQKAQKNYYTKTADSRDDPRFKFNFELGSAGAEKLSVPDYSYNWPYDYFSLIELAKLDAEVIIGDSSEFFPEDKENN